MLFPVICLKMELITMMERRKFIQACTVLLGSTVLTMGCGQGGSDSSQADNYTMPDLSRNRWVDIPDTLFSVAHDTYGAIDMTVTAIDDGIYDPVTDQFSIVLTGPELPLLKEDVYQVYNSTFGYIELYLQPGESPAGVQNYRTHFSLLQS
jgi:hypothetical protein